MYYIPEQGEKRSSVFLVALCSVSVISKMCSLRGAAVDVILIQERTDISTQRYFQSMGHINMTEDNEGPMFLLPSVHCLLLVGFLPVEIYVRWWGL